MRILLEKWFGGEMASCFIPFVVRCFFGRRGSLGGLRSCDRSWGGGLTEVIPVVAVVTYEVCDLAEGLVRDSVFEWHGGIVCR